MAWMDNDDPMIPMNNMQWSNIIIIMYYTTRHYLLWVKFKYIHDIIDIVHIYRPDAEQPTEERSAFSLTLLHQLP